MVLQKAKKFVSAFLAATLLTTGVATIAPVSSVSAATVEASVDPTDISAMGTNWGVTSDGSKVLYMANNTRDGKESDALYLYDTVAKTLSKIAPGGAGNFHKFGAMSDNGSVVMYSKAADYNNYSAKLFMYDVSTGVETEIGPTYQYLRGAVSDDGSKIAYFSSTNNQLMIYDVASKTSKVVPLYTTTAHMLNNNTNFYSPMSFRSNGDLYFIARTSSSAANDSTNILRYDGTSTTIINGVFKPKAVYAVSDNGKYLMNYDSILNTETGISTPALFSFSGYVYDVNIVGNRYLSLATNLYDIQTKDLYNMPEGVLSKDGTKYIAKNVVSTGGLLENGIPKPVFVYKVVGSVNAAQPRNATINGIASVFNEKIMLRYNGNVIYDSQELTNPYVSYSSSGISLKKFPLNFDGSTLEVGSGNKSGITWTPIVGLSTSNNFKKTLAGQSVDEGAIVRFGNVNWEVIGDNLLLTTNELTSMPMDTSGANSKYNPTSPTNLGYYLNNTFYNSLSSSEKEIINTRNWKIYKFGSTSLDSTVTAKVGLATAAELTKANFSVVNDSNWSSDFWVMDYSNSASSAPAWSGYGAPSGKLVNSTPSSNQMVRPAIELVSTASIASGSGTIFDPYVLSSVPVEQVSAPINLKVSTKEVNNVALQWDEVAGATGYNIYKDGVKIGTSATPVYKDSAVAVGTYSYTVTALKNTAESPKSASLSVTVADVPVTLDTPKDLQAVVNAYNHVFLAWGAVTGADSYNVYRNGVLVKNVNSTQYDDTTITPETAYQYSVEAVKGTVKSTQVSVNVVTPKETIPYPAHFTVTKTTYQEIGLEWEAVTGATGYEVYRGNTQLTTTTGTSFTDETATPGTLALYKVRAVKNGVYSEFAVKEVTVPVKPIVGEAPKAVNDLKLVRAYADRVKLSWSSVTDATYSDVYRDSSLVYSGPLTAFTDMGTASEETYQYTVYSANEFGKTKGNTITVTTPAEAPAIIITPAQPEGSFTITWNFKTVENADTYYVERNPQWTYKSNGDGTYTRSYYNTATGETMNMGTVRAVNGELPFIETGVEPAKSYAYDVTAVKRNSATGQEEVVGNTTVAVQTPADGSSATVDKGTAPTPDTGSDNGGTGSDNDNGSSNKDKKKDRDTSGTTPGTTPGTTTGGGGGGSAPVTPTNPTTSTTPGTTDTGTTGGKGTTPTPTPVATPAVAFTDVPATSFAKEAITNLVNQGVVNGYPDGTFHPERAVSRAEFAIMISRGLGLTDNRAYDYNFKDFDVNAWYADDLTTALHNGVTKGYTPDLYKPSKTIPRQEAAIMLTNMITSQGKASLSFTDKGEIIGWAKDAVAEAVKAGLMQGYATGDFKPYGEVTRAEAAVMVDRLMKLRMQ